MLFVFFVANLFRSGAAMLKLAIVGGRGFALEHYENIRQWGPELGCQVVALAVRPRPGNEANIERFQRDGMRLFGDAEEMFAALAGQVDGVIIPSSIDTHCRLTCRALELGHHVYLEKPPAGTIQEVDTMLAAARTAEQNGQVCLLGFQAIFTQSINLIKDRVVSGELGRVRRLRCWALWSRDQAYYTRNQWVGRLKHGEAWILDGPTNNALAHQTANLLYLACPRPREFSRPTAVRAELYHAHPVESDDTASHYIQTADGPEAWFITSHCTEAICEGPFIEMDCEKAQVRWKFEGPADIAYSDGRREHADDPCRPAKAPLESFVQAVRARDPSQVMCNLEMGRNYSLAVNGFFESAGQVRSIPADLVRIEGHGPKSRYIVAGLDDAIIRCGREGKLFSEIGVPWAVPTKPFELDGYSHFPQRFAARESRKGS